MQWRRGLFGIAIGFLLCGCSDGSGPSDQVLAQLEISGTVDVFHPVAGDTLPLRISVVNPLHEDVPLRSATTCFVRAVRVTDSPDHEEQFLGSGPRACAPYPTTFVVPAMDSLVVTVRVVALLPADTVDGFPVDPIPWPSAYTLMAELDVPLPWVSVRILLDGSGYHSFLGDCGPVPSNAPDTLSLTSFEVARAFVGTRIRYQLLNPTERDRYLYVCNVDVVSALDRWADTAWIAGQYYPQGPCNDRTSGGYPVRAHRCGRAVTYLESDTISGTFRLRLPNGPVSEPFEIAPDAPHIIIR